VSHKLELGVAHVIAPLHVVVVHVVSLRAESGGQWIHVEDSGGMSEVALRYVPAQFNVVLPARSVVARIVVGAKRAIGTCRGIATGENTLKKNMEKYRTNIQKNVEIHRESPTA
jgi:hypothetical protein